MLIALIAYLFLGGGAGTPDLLIELKHMEKSIKQQIEDPALQVQALETLRSMKATTKQYAKNHAKTVKAILKSSKAHDRDLIEIKAILKKSEQDTQRFQKTILDYLDTLKMTLNRSQWELITSEAA